MQLQKYVHYVRTFLFLSASYKNRIIYHIKIIY